MLSDLEFIPQMSFTVLCVNITK